jgi:hypothetical protein
MHTIQFGIDQRRTIAAVAHPAEFQTFSSEGNRLLFASHRAIPIGDRDSLQDFIAALKTRADEPPANGSNPKTSSAADGDQLSLPIS